MFLFYLLLNFQKYKWHADRYKQRHGSISDNKFHMKFISSAVNNIEYKTIFISNSFK